MGEAICKMMKQLLDTAGLEKGGVCLLILVGREEDEPLTDAEVVGVRKTIPTTMKKPTTRKRQKSGDSTLSSISSYIVTVNSNAKYGIGEMLQLTTSPGGERAEIYSSHFCLGKLLESKDEVGGALRAGLRKKTHQGQDKDLDHTRKLWEALNNPPTQQNQQGVDLNS